MGLADIIEGAITGVYRGAAAVARLVRARRATVAETRAQMSADQRAQQDELRRVLRERGK